MPRSFRCRPTRSTAIVDGSSRRSPLEPRRPTRLQGGGGPARVGLRPPTGSSGGLPWLQQLWPAPVPREADSALRPQRLHGDQLRSTATAGRCVTGCTLTTSAAAIHTVLQGGRPGSVYNVGGPDEWRNRRRDAGVELTGTDEPLIDYVKDRAGHDRRYSLGQREGPRGAGLGGAGALRRRHRPNGRLVPGQRGPGGSRSARASTATTTSASTAAALSG